MLGSDLANQIRVRNPGTPLGELMVSLAPQIEQDRQTLLGLMRRIHSTPNPIKQASAWVGEKASRVKFWGPTAGSAELGTFLALESLALGVRGKLSLWEALGQVAERYPAIASVDLTELAGRAQGQYEALERHRLEACERALGHAAPAA